MPLIWSWGDDGTLVSYENTTPRGVGITVTVTPEADAPVMATLPTAVTVIEDTPSDLDLSAMTLSDADTAGDITFVLTAAAGTMVASTGTGTGVTVTVTGTDTAPLTLVGTATAIDTYLNTASAVQYTGALDVFGDGAATLTLTGDDGSGVTALSSVNIDITDLLDSQTGPPGPDTLTGDNGRDVLIGLGGKDILRGFRETTH